MNTANSLYRSNSHLYWYRYLNRLYIFKQCRYLYRLYRYQYQDSDSTAVSAYCSRSWQWERTAATLVVGGRAPWVKDRRPVLYGFYLCTTNVGLNPRVALPHTKPAVRSNQSPNSHLSELLSWMLETLAREMMDRSSEVNSSIRLNM